MIQKVHKIYIPVLHTVAQQDLTQLDPRYFAHHISEKEMAYLQVSKLK